LHPGPLRGGGEEDTAVQDVRMPGWHVGDPLHSADGRLDLLRVEHVGHHYLGAEPPETVAAPVLPPDQRANLHRLSLEELLGDGRPDIPRRPGDQDGGSTHDSILSCWAVQSIARNDAEHGRYPPIRWSDARHPSGG